MQPGRKERLLCFASCSASPSLMLEAMGVAEPPIPFFTLLQGYGGLPHPRKRPRELYTPQILAGQGGGSE